MQIGSEETAAVADPMQTAEAQEAATDDGGSVNLWSDASTASAMDDSLPEVLPGQSDSSLPELAGGIFVFTELAISIATLAVAFLLFRWLYKLIIARNAPQPLAPAGDTMRFAMASLILKGGSFRRTIIEMDDHPFRARAPEIDIDFPLLAKAARYYESRSVAVSWMMSIFSVVMLAAFFGLMLSATPESGVEESSASLWSIGPLLLLISAAIGLQLFNRFFAARSYRRENFDLSIERARFGHTEAVPEQNVICYGVQNPFVGLGTPLGSWCIPIDPSRPMAGHSTPPGTASARGLMGEIATRIERLNIPGMSIRDIVFVSGTEAAQFPSILNGRFEQPRPTLDIGDMASFLRENDFRARAYRCLSVKDWQGDLLYFYLYRCIQRGGALFVEATRTMLGPVHAQYREIDMFRRLGIRSTLSWFLLAALKSPLVVIEAFLGAYVSLETFRSKLWGTIERQETREVLENPVYNYGALNSVRQIMSSNDDSVYFRAVDQNLYAQTLDQQVLWGAGDYLKENGVDASMFDEQAATVMNSTTFVNTGTIVSQSKVSGIVAGTKSRVNASASGIGSK